MLFLFHNVFIIIIIFDHYFFFFVVQLVLPDKACQPEEMNHQLVKVFLTDHKVVIRIHGQTPMTEVGVFENELRAPQEIVRSCRVVKKNIFYQQVMTQMTARFHQVLVLLTVLVKLAVQVLMPISC